MANVYLEEGNLENAYILYMKFMTLFVEKIRKHPEYTSVPAQVSVHFYIFRHLYLEQLKSVIVIPYTVY